MARESQLHQNIKYPGIQRQGMPKKSEKSKSQRDRAQSEYFGFVQEEGQEQEVRRLLDLVRFTKEIDNG